MAEINSYPENVIDKLVKKRKRDILWNILTFQLGEEPKKKLLTPFMNHVLQDGFYKVFKRFDMKVVFKITPKSMNSREFMISVVKNCDTEYVNTSYGSILLSFKF